MASRSRRMSRDAGAAGNRGAHTGGDEPPAKPPKPRADEASGRINSQLLALTVGDIRQYRWGEHGAITLRSAAKVCANRLTGARNRRNWSRAAIPDGQQ